MQHVPNVVVKAHIIMVCAMSVPIGDYEWDDSTTLDDDEDEDYDYDEDSNDY